MFEIWRNGSEFYFYFHVAFRETWTAPANPEFDIVTREKANPNFNGYSGQGMKISLLLVHY